MSWDNIMVTERMTRSKSRLNPRPLEPEPEPESESDSNDEVFLGTGLNPERIQQPTVTVLKNWMAVKTEKYYNPIVAPKKEEQEDEVNDDMVGPGDEDESRGQETPPNLIENKETSPPAESADDRPTKTKKRRLCKEQAASTISIEPDLDSPLSQSQASVLRKVPAVKTRARGARKHIPAASGAPKRSRGSGSSALKSYIPFILKYIEDLKRESQKMTRIHADGEKAIQPLIIKDIFKPSTIKMIVEYSDKHATDFNVWAKKYKRLQLMARSPCDIYDMMILFTRKRVIQTKQQASHFLLKFNPAFKFRNEEAAMIDLEIMTSGLNVPPIYGPGQKSADEPRLYDGMTAAQYSFYQAKLVEHYPTSKYLVMDPFNFQVGTKTSFFSRNFCLKSGIIEMRRDFLDCPREIQGAIMPVWVREPNASVDHVFILILDFDGRKVNWIGIKGQDQSVVAKEAVNVLNIIFWSPPGKSGIGKHNSVGQPIFKQGTGLPCPFIDQNQPAKACAFIALYNVSLWLAGAFHETIKSEGLNIDQQRMVAFEEKLYNLHQG